MAIILVAADVSKGYADFRFEDQAGNLLVAPRCFDDTPGGHEAVRQQVLALGGQHRGALFVFGVENTGGLERNWVKLFRSLPVERKVHELNPLAVKRCVECQLHRNVTDRLSAEAIALYLRQMGQSAPAAAEPQMEGPRLLLRHVMELMEQGAQVRNRLQSLLPSVHPALVAQCRDGIPGRVLELLVKYPTVTQLAAADAAVVAQIPYWTQARGAKMIAQAQESIAALRDGATGLVVASLARQALALAGQVQEHQKKLWEMLKEDRETRILKSIPGIGRWTAVVLRLEMGPMARFHSASAAVAFAGLDPRVHQSGDGEVHIGISHRGRHRIRYCLFLPTKTATRCNAAIAAFYERLKAAGKEYLVAITACMAKLLRIAYACVVSGQEFDAQRHEVVRKRHEAAREAAAARDGQQPEPDEAVELQLADAPISWKEAKRRRKLLAVASNAAAVGAGTPNALAPQAA